MVTVIFMSWIFLIVLLDFNVPFNQYMGFSGLNYVMKFHQYMLFALPIGVPFFLLQHYPITPVFRQNVSYLPDEETSALKILVATQSYNTYFRQSISCLPDEQTSAL